MFGFNFLLQKRGNIFYMCINFGITKRVDLTKLFPSLFFFGETIILVPKVYHVSTIDSSSFK